MCRQDVGYLIAYRYVSSVHSNTIHLKYSKSTRMFEFNPAHSLLDFECSERSCYKNAFLFRHRCFGHYSIVDILRFLFRLVTVASKD